MSLAVFLTGNVSSEHLHFSWFFQHFSTDYSLLMYAKAPTSFWHFHAYKSETEVLEKGELRGTYLGSAACNRRELYSTPTFYSEKSICMAPSCSETINHSDIADHLDFFRLGRWISEIPILFPVFMEQQCLLLPDSNTFPLDNERGNRSRGIIFFLFFHKNILMNLY